MKIVKITNLQSHIYQKILGILTGELLIHVSIPLKQLNPFESSDDCWKLSFICITVTLTNFGTALPMVLDLNSNYCKRGYFRWGKISRKCWQDISRGGNFHDTAPISFIKAYGYNFRVGVIFAKKTKARKTRKITPTRKFPRLQYLLSCKWNELELVFVLSIRIVVVYSGIIRHILIFWQNLGYFSVFNLHLHTN